MSNGTGEGDDWESLLESGNLDKSLAKLKVVEVKLDPFGDPLPSMSGSQASLTNAFSGPVKILTNVSRNQYRRPEPTLKILKRPEPENNKALEPQVPKNITKTLEQREAEYAEARQRILGNEPVAAKTNPVKQQNGGGGKRLDNAAKKPGNGGNQRTPKGPDGGKGFPNKR